MSNENGFYSFMRGIEELAKTLKPDERIVVDIYDPYGIKLNDDDKL